MLHDGPFDKVAGLEVCHCVVVLFLGDSDLGGGCSVKGWQYWENRSNKGHSGGDAFVGWDAADETEVALVAATEGGSNGFCVGFTFSFELGETCVGWVADDFCQHWMLEIVFPVVYEGIRHGLLS